VGQRKWLESCESCLWDRWPVASSVGDADKAIALESAMDELAYGIGVDPVALRLRNDTAIDPHSGRSFSTRAMRECLMAGGTRFG
jgi:xanthine dehydrogenase YagR molybdenum-binding subunit